MTAMKFHQLERLIATTCAEPHHDPATLRQRIPDAACRSGSMLQQIGNAAGITKALTYPVADATQKPLT